LSELPLKAGVLNADAVPTFFLVTGPLFLAFFYGRE
jgi:hypothetical protein